MGAKASTAGNGERDETRERTFSSSSTEGGGGGGGFDVLRAGVGPGERGRSFSTPGVAHGQQPFESQETDSSSTEAESPISAAFPRVYPTHALPSHIFSWNEWKNHEAGMGIVVGTCIPHEPPLQDDILHIRRIRYGIKCPVCSKFVLPDDIECHLVMCLTKPRLIYNEDILTEDKGECVICLEDLSAGNTIARLPCLCIYHKSCIDRWFDVNRSCPEHPGD